MVENLLSFALATFFLALSRGPDNMYVLTQSLANGVKSGLATTAGLISGCIVHTTLLAFGISALITASEHLFYAIKIFGACYLLFLAYKIYISENDIKISGQATKKPYFKLYKLGVFMNLVNPKVMIFFLAFFPGFLWNTEDNAILQFYILGGVFMIVSLFTFSVIAIMAGRISRFLVRNRNTGIFLKWLQIIVFTGIAMYILIP